MDFPGFRIQARMARAYRTPNLAHALGYVGAITPAFLEKPQVRQVPARAKTWAFRAWKPTTSTR
ncbi:MAG: hypothetical protein WKG07_20685 [Hymenobacter sp.]